MPVEFASAPDMSPNSRMQATKRTAYVEIITRGEVTGGQFTDGDVRPGIQSEYEGIGPFHVSHGKILGSGHTGVNEVTGNTGAGSSTLLTMHTPPVPAQRICGTGRKLNSPI